MIQWQCVTQALVSVHIETLEVQSLYSVLFFPILSIEIMSETVHFPEAFPPFGSLKLLIASLIRHPSTFFSFSLQRAPLTPYSQCMWVNSIRGCWKPALNLKRSKEKVQLTFGGCSMMEVRNLSKNHRERDFSVTQYKNGLGKLHKTGFY